MVYRLLPTLHTHTHTHTHTHLMRQKKDFSCMQSAGDDSLRRKNKSDEFRFNSIASCLSEVTKSAVNSS